MLSPAGLFAPLAHLAHTRRLRVRIAPVSLSCAELSEGVRVLLNQGLRAPALHLNALSPVACRASVMALAHLLRSR
jgi:hypothetical protein